jgi:uncharacterized protein (TIGR00251 family)
MLRVDFEPGWVAFQVRVLPRASTNELAGVMEGALRVRLTAPPVEGKANKALRDFLAKFLGVSKGDVEIVSGGSSRNKRVAIKGLDIQGLDKRLGAVGIRTTKCERNRKLGPGGRGAPDG